MAIGIGIGIPFNKKPAEKGLLQLGTVLHALDNLTGITSNRVVQIAEDDILGDCVELAGELEAGETKYTNTLTIDLGAAGLLTDMEFIEFLVMLGEQTVANIEVKIGSWTTFLNGFKAELKPYYFPGSKVITSFKKSTAGFTTIGSGVWANCRYIRLTVIYQNGSTPVPVRIKTLQKNKIERAYSIMTFDDTLANQWAVIEYMHALGLVGHIYYNSAYVGDTGKLTLAQLQTAASWGFSIGAHPAIEGLTEEQIIAALAAEKAYQIENNISYGWEHIAYNNTEYDDTCIAVLKAQGYKTGRIGQQYYNYHSDWSVDDNLYKLNSYIWNNATTHALAKIYVDRIMGSGGVLPQTIHNPVETPSVSTDVNIAELYLMIDYLAANRASIKSVNMPQWYKAFY